MRIPLKFIGIGLLGLWYVFTIASRAKIEKPEILEVEI
jgi:hypothetical protein